MDQNDLEAIYTLKAIGVRLALVTMRQGKSAGKALGKAGLQAGCLVTTPHKIIQALNRTIRVGSLHELLDVLRFEVNPSIKEP
ncbi:MAG: hypothetical protein QE164_06050 [Candidatus Nezhaarchaeota archaeon]|nr:hypothetical protein [Candidatus Nezhaarchaeota archaeon]